MTAARRYLLITLGSAGDLHPVLGLARGLRRSGHDVELMSNAPYREAVEAEGVRFSPLCSRDDHDRAASHPDLWHPTRGFGVLWRYLAVPAIEPVRERVIAFLGSDPSPGHVLASPLAVGARLARMVRDYPLCSLYTAPSNLRSLSDPMYLGDWRVPTALPPFFRQLLWWDLDRRKLEPMVRPALAPAFARLGVEAPHKSTFGRWIHSPDGGVTLFPDWFCTRQPDWPKRLQMGSFPLFEASGSGSLDAGTENFLAAGPRPVVVFPGSIAGERGIALVRYALSACRALGMRAIILGLGDPAWQAATEGGTSDTVHRCSHASLARLLPRAAVFVHRGGVGSCAQGLYRRVPQLISPQAFDQFDNAERVEHEGGGRQIRMGTGYRIRFLSMLEELSGGASGAILDRLGAHDAADGSGATMPVVLEALARWEADIGTAR